MKRGNGRLDNLRMLLTQEAARIMAQQGITDFRLAKQKAAERLGITDIGVLPKNSEIEAALSAYQRLFSGDAHSEWLTQLRESAHSAMRFFSDFRPRLVGPVLNGTTTANSGVDLHLFADTPEAIAVHLMAHDIPHQSRRTRMRSLNGATAEYPVFRFFAGEVAIAATVFPVKGLREAPSSRVDGRPMRRASLRELEQILNKDN